MKYKAIYLPADKNAPKDKVFKSYKAACKYIEKHSCKICRNAVKKGYMTVQVRESNFKLAVYFDPISDILDTPCGAEWMIEEIK